MWPFFPLPWDVCTQEIAVELYPFLGLAGIS